MQGVKTSSNVINKIIQLRKTGYSIGEIHKLTSKSKSLIFNYVKRVKIDSKYTDRLKEKQKSSIYRSQQDWIKAKKISRLIIPKLKKTERILIAACLYWGEGTKKYDFSLSNTDPYLIKVFTRSLESLGISKNQLRITIRIYEDINKLKAINYWSKIIGVRPEKILNVNVLRGKKTGKLPYGMCRIRLTKGSFTFKTVMSIIDYIKQQLCPRSLMDKTTHS